MPIPPFNYADVLPPYLADAVGHPRSPYVCSLDDVVSRFATSTERTAILRGLLDYREALRTQLGLAEGLQCLDESFVEDVETSEQRAPADVDVLTVARFPPASTLSAPQRRLLDRPTRRSSSAATPTRWTSGR
jgi:hypothetical protein